MIGNTMLHVLMLMANNPMFAIPTLHHREIATPFGAVAVVMTMTLTAMTIPMMIMIHMETTKTAAITMTAVVTVEAMTKTLPPTMPLLLNRICFHPACGTSQVSLKITMVVNTEFASLPF